jgi:hypothetical protein
VLARIAVLLSGATTGDTIAFTECRLAIRLRPPALEDNPAF